MIRFLTMFKIPSFKRNATNDAREVGGGGDAHKI